MDIRTKKAASYLNARIYLMKKEIKAFLFTILSFIFLTVPVFSAGSSEKIETIDWNGFVYTWKRELQISKAPGLDIKEFTVYPIKHYMQKEGFLYSITKDKLIIKNAPKVDLVIEYGSGSRRNIVVLPREKDQITLENEFAELRPITVKDGLNGSFDDWISVKRELTVDDIPIHEMGDLGNSDNKVRDQKKISYSYNKILVTECDPRFFMTLPLKFEFSDLEGFAFFKVINLSNNQYKLTIMRRDQTRIDNHRFAQIKFPIANSRKDQFLVQMVLRK
jgi:hypothetical protein